MKPLTSILPERTSDVQARTIDDFGVQWNIFDDIDTGYYGESELFDDILRPFLSKADIHGKYVCEIGSGTGRVALMLLKAGGARHILAIEPSRAFDVMLERTKDLKDRLTCLNVAGDEIPEGEDLDYVFSIGVIHHIPDPQPTMKAALEALKPGGQMLIWIYGYEGNGWYLAIARPLRFLSHRLPVSWVQALTWLLLPALWAYILCCRVIPLPMHQYMTDVLGKLDGRQLCANIFDQLRPAYAKYYREHEARALMGSAGFADVRLHHRHGYSWTVIGTRPAAVAE